jgi:DNA replication and repair protein RecF
LGFWDEHLAEHGAYLTAARFLIVGEVCIALAERSRAFVSTSLISASYAPSLGQDFVSAARIEDPADHVRAVAKREFQTQIRVRRDEELRRGVTLIGPHRDDLDLLIDGRSLAAFGSRGQQRLGIVALKMAEADVAATRGERPVLLLDDILSELDPTHRSLLFESIAGFGAQLLITSADAEQVGDASLSALRRAAVTPGGVWLT